MFREFAGLLKRASAIAGVASLVAFAGQANAASYVGSWDPAFGSAFPNLGWRGEAVFEIPDACLLTDGVYVNGNLLNSNPSSCVDGGGLRIISAEVEFYNVNDPNTVLDTLNFTEPSATITMEVTDGDLSGVIGGFLTFATSDISLITSMGYLGAEATFTLGFRDEPLFSGSGDYYAQMGWVQWRTCRFGLPCLKGGVSDLENQSGRSFLTFREIGLEVPEPGSLALLLPAVGMLAAFRRRRSSPATA